MPSTQQSQEKRKLFEREFLCPGGAGGEPLGELPATPASPGQSRQGQSERLVDAVLGKSRSPISDELVETAIEQRRLRTAIRDLGEAERRELAEAVLDGLADGELGEQASERLLDAMIDGLIAGKRGEAEILGQGGVLGDLTRRVVERALGEELSEHLGYPAGQAPPGARNGGTPKTILTDHGPVRIDTPRDRKSRFEPQLVGKGQRRLAGLDDKIVALYAGGMTTREIETYMQDLYGPGISRETVSRVTASVLEDAKAWQPGPSAPDPGQARPHRTRVAE